MYRSVAHVVDLTDPALNALSGITLEAARARVASGDAESVSALDGSYVLVGVDGITVRLARSLDRPLRYFLAKEADGPVLVVADRIDTLKEWLVEHGHGDQFHPSYTRMVPAHHVTTLRLVGCPDPAPSHVRTFTPAQSVLPQDLDEIGRLYIGALADEIAKWIGRVPMSEPVGVCFSGGIDSGAVFLVTHHVLGRLGMSPARLKAFTLSVESGPDLAQARRFLAAREIRIRSFILVGVPFLQREEWAAATRVSVETSFRAGARTVSLIPTRLGNGALEELQRRGQFVPPTLADLEDAVGGSFERETGTGLLLADLWDVDRLEAAPCCAPARVGRLREMNLRQENLPFPLCPDCGLIRSRASSAPSSS